MEAVAEPAAARPAESVEAQPIAGVEGGRRYSTLVIFFPQHDGEALEAAVKDVKSLMEREGAIIFSADSMGRRALAYKIKKQSEGVYVNFVYSSLPRAISLIERDLGHKESVMRFLTTMES